MMKLLFCNLNVKTANMLMQKQPSLKIIIHIKMLIYIKVINSENKRVMNTLIFKLHTYQHYVHS